jgi:soluble lytic murein transglycosylase-like protein
VSGRLVNEFSLMGLISRKNLITRVISLLMTLTLVFILLPLGRAGAQIIGYQDRDGFWHFPAPESRKRDASRVRSSQKDLEALFQAYQLTIREASETFGVDSNLIKAVIQAESDFNYRAMSRKGAVGLMQLMPETARKMEVKNPFDPNENILGGTRYLAVLLKRFDNNKPMALAAFNAGPELVEACGRVPAIKETRRYVNKVLFYYERLRNKAE